MYSHTYALAIQIVRDGIRLSLTLSFLFSKIVFNAVFYSK